MTFIIDQKIDYKAIYLACMAIKFIVYINILFLYLKAIQANILIRVNYLK